MLLPVPIITFSRVPCTRCALHTRRSSALDAGYRHIDTALLYGNHKEVGEAIAAHSVPRDKIWLTSKVGFFPKTPEGFEGELWMYV